MTHLWTNDRDKTDVPLGLQSVPPNAPFGAGNLMCFGGTAVIFTDRFTAERILNMLRGGGTGPAQ